MQLDWATHVGKEEAAQEKKKVGPFIQKVGPCLKKIGPYLQTFFVDGKFTPEDLICGRPSLFIPGGGTRKS